MQSTAASRTTRVSGASSPESVHPGQNQQASGVLAGWTALHSGRFPAGDIALRHLSCLGASLQRHPEGNPEDGNLHLLPPGTDESGLTCHIGWACRDAPGTADETAVQAVAGLMAVHGRRRGVPTRLPLDYASTCAGVLAVQGVLASLIARGRGTAITRTGTSVTHAALLTVSQYLAAATGDEEEVLPQDTPEAGPPFRSRDGVLFEVEALEPGPWLAFWSELGVAPADIGRAWRPFVLRYPQATCPLPKSLSAAAAALPFEAITEVAGRTGMSLCRVRTMAERRGDPDAVRHGAVPAPWDFTPPTTPVPPAGQAQRSARHFMAPELSLPLQGLTVVEAGRRVQAPMAAHVLHLLGARVVRIEPPEGDPLRGIPPMAGDCSARFIALNKGKEVLPADLKSPAGRAAVLDVIRDADVFLHNWAPGKAAVFGLDAVDLQAVNPRLVYGYASGWGHALGEKPPLGTDFMAQAHSGLADLMASGDTPRPSLMTLLDVLGGLVAAEGLLAGLLQREQTGRGLRVDTSLLSASTVLQYEALEQPRNQKARGCGAAMPPLLDGPWKTADGWLALSARSHTAVGRLCRSLGLDPSAPEEDLRAELTVRLAKRPTAIWTGELAAAGVASTEVTTDLRQLDRNHVTRHALVREECTLVTAPWRFDA
ncbi:CoA transferase [Streptomyces sp. URMC 127]|uniref:CoA transferase n=1 Tax=Streptomyces sp. URMC 127 TaxID=3423402 RepID=UPI003F1A29D9